MAKLQLPASSGVKGSVVGSPQKRKPDAKVSATLKACRILHEAGELNEFLLLAAMKPKRKSGGGREGKTLNCDEDFEVMNFSKTLPEVLSTPLVSSEL